MDQLTATVYLGWGLVVPAVLSLLDGLIVYHAVGLLGYKREGGVGVRDFLPLAFLFLFVCWSMTGFSLPIFYILVFLIKTGMICYRREYHTRDLFLINLTHLLVMALHLILIGGTSLVTSIPMNELLRNPFWRIAITSVALVVDGMIAGLCPRRKSLLRILKHQLDSEEVGPFLAFLWFCNVFLLIDSVLCISAMEWNWLPLFLITGTLLVEFFLIRFLLHLFAVLTAKELEREHQRLVEELSIQKKADQELRAKSRQDSLTGIFGRWYAMEQIETLLKNGTSFSLVYIDLDHLKQINDRDGHLAGDEYLRQFAKALGEFLRESDTFARIGGDEFIVLLPECWGEVAKDRMEHIRLLMDRDYTPPLAFSFGTVFVPDHSELTVEEVLRLADQEMYKDKKKRK